MDFTYIVFRFVVDEGSVVGRDVAEFDGARCSNKARKDLKFVWNTSSGLLLVKLFHLPQIGTFWFHCLLV